MVFIQGVLNVFAYLNLLEMNLKLREDLGELRTDY